MPRRDDSRSRRPDGPTVVRFIVAHRLPRHLTGMGAPKWPPNPQRSSRPGKAGALLEYSGRLL